MKPKDLKLATTFETRHVYFEDGVLYVPAFYERYDEWRHPGWAALFGNAHPVQVEYCAGHGHWIVERAKAERETNFVAVEKRFDRVRKIWSKVKNHGLNNLIIVCGEAHTATRHFFPSNSTAKAYINFPDPWPRRRHAKHRLVHDEFLSEVRRTLTVGGSLTLATDYQDYVTRYLELMQGRKDFGFAFEAPHFITQWPSYGSSFFERLWTDEGRTIYYTSSLATVS